MRNPGFESVCVVKRGAEEYWNETSRSWTRDTDKSTLFDRSHAELVADLLTRTTGVPCRAVEVICNKRLEDIF